MNLNLLANKSLSARKKLIETFQYEDFSIANCIFQPVLVLQGADIFKKCTASWKLPRHGSSNQRKKDQEAPLSTNCLCNLSCAKTWPDAIFKMHSRIKQLCYACTSCTFLALEKIPRPWPAKSKSKLLVIFVIPAHTKLSNKFKSIIFIKINCFVLKTNL